jgi:hypothetical protein
VACQLLRDAVEKKLLNFNAIILNSISLFNLKNLTQLSSSKITVGRVILCFFALQQTSKDGK